MTIGLTLGTVPTLVVPTLETTGTEVDTRFRSLRDTIVSSKKFEAERLFAISSTRPVTLILRERLPQSPHPLLHLQR